MHERLKPHAPPRGAPSAGPAPAGRVLVLEDEEDLGFLLRQNLGAQGWTVTLCPALAPARRALAAEPFDLLLLDVGLPDGSGFELLRELRARQVWTPAVFLTARADEADRLTGFAAGGDDCGIL